MVADRGGHSFAGDTFPDFCDPRTVVINDGPPNHTETRSFLTTKDALHPKNRTGHVKNNEANKFTQQTDFFQVFLCFLFC